jgi:hypothetical protein
MIPIFLDWQRPADGAEIVDPSTADGRMERSIRARSAHREPVNYRIGNLENPVALHLINAEDEADLVAFVQRFGMPERLGPPTDSDEAAFSSIKMIRDELEDLLWSAGTPDPVARALRANQLLKNTALHPAIEFSAVDGRHRLILRPASLADLLFMEAAVAFDVGATMTRCAHCSKAYLTGPMTGRRSSSVYCSDRCRVAAMRARNAAKEVQ